MSDGILALGCIYLALAGLFWAMLANVTMEAYKSGLAALLWPLTIFVLVAEVTWMKFDERQ